MAIHLDPVCGMEIDEADARAKSTHQGRTYYFCSEGCRTRFEQNPSRFVGAGGELSPRDEAR